METRNLFQRVLMLLILSALLLGGPLVITVPVAGGTQGLVTPVDGSVGLERNSYASDSILIRDEARATEALPAAPLTFIENIGQFKEGTRFQVRRGARTIWLAEDGIWLTVVENPGKEV